MLSNFFRLDGTPTTHDEGNAMPSMSPGDEVTNMLFRGTKWGRPRMAIKGVTFRNVSIANMGVYPLGIGNFGLK